MIEEDAQTRAGTPRLTFAYISLFHLVSTLEGVSESVNRHYLDGPREPLPSNMVEDSDEPLESARIRFRDTHFDVFQRIRTITFFERFGPARVSMRSIFFLRFPGF